MRRPVHFKQILSWPAMPSERKAFSASPPSPFQAERRRLPRSRVDQAFLVTSRPDSYADSCSVGRPRRARCRTDYREAVRITRRQIRWQPHKSCNSKGFETFSGLARRVPPCMYRLAQTESLTRSIQWRPTILTKRTKLRMIHEEVIRRL